MNAREHQARAAVDRILESLKDRSGFGDLIEGIELEDPDTYEEIKASLARIVLDEIPF